MPVRGPRWARALARTLVAPSLALVALTTIVGGVVAASPVASAARPGVIEARRPHPGTLVLVGGGPTPGAVFERTLALAGGRRAVVVVLPQTYPDDSIADAAVALWQKLQAAQVVKASRSDAAAAERAIAGATLVGMPGGYPSYFMRAIRDTAIAAAIRARFAAGMTIGGASAGAVAMSATMLADEGSVAASAGTADGLTEPGLGLWPEAIVSPHFTERRRLAPLRPVLQAHADLYGVGLDEGTAVFVRDGSFDVVGRGHVSVIEPHQATVRVLNSGARYRYRREPH